MLHYELVFGNVFERRESKCCGVLMKHRRKAKGEQVITLQMAQQSKTKTINAVPGQLSCRQQAISNLPVMALVEQLKRHVAMRSLQRSLNNQILDYKSILDLCENEMMSIKFFGICKESMISVENLEIIYRGGDTVAVTRSSHHLVPLSSLLIDPKLTSED